MHVVRRRRRYVADARAFYATANEVAPHSVGEPPGIPRNTYTSGRKTAGIDNCVGLKSRLAEERGKTEYEVVANRPNTGWKKVIKKQSFCIPNSNVYAKLGIVKRRTRIYVCTFLPKTTNYTDGGSYFIALNFFYNLSNLLFHIVHLLLLLFSFFQCFKEDFHFAF